MLWEKYNHIRNMIVEYSGIYLFDIFCKMLENFLVSMIGFNEIYSFAFTIYFFFISFFTEMLHFINSFLFELVLVRLCHFTFTQMAQLELITAATLETVKEPRTTTNHD